MESDDGVQAWKNTRCRQTRSWMMFLLGYYQIFCHPRYRFPKRCLSLKSKQTNTSIFFFFSSSRDIHPLSRKRVTALVLIFKSRAIWPSSHDRPDTNRQSDANVTSSQNVISHAPFVPWHFFFGGVGECPQICWFKSDNILLSSRLKTKKNPKKSNLENLSIRNWADTGPVTLPLSARWLKATPPAKKKKENNAHTVLLRKHLFTF